MSNQNGIAFYGSQSYSSPTYFSATYLGAQTLTLAGLPWTPVSAQILGVEVDTVQGTVQVYPRTNFKISLDPVTLILTVTGAGFLATDLAYRVFFIGVDKGYSPATNSFAFGEIAPLNQVVVEESLSDSALVTATANFPSDDGLTMLGYKSFSLTGKLIEPDAVNTVLTVWATNDEDATAASRDWISLYGYRSDTNTIINSITVNAATVTFGWDFDNLNYKYVRVLLTAGNGSNKTVILKCRRVAL